MMKMFCILLLALVITACAPESQPAGVASVTASSESVPSRMPTIAPSQRAATESILPTITLAGSTPETPGNCASPDATAMGAAIAKDYAFTNTEEVMGWFCAGAEFEDILTALQTEKLTGTPAKDMLEMLAAGLTWEEIWQVLGIAE